MIPDPQKRAEYERLFVASTAPKRAAIRRPSDGKPVGPSEHQVQVAVIQWWRLQHQIYALPEFALFAIPNGGARDPITGARLKAEGVRAGALDLCLAAPRGTYHGWYGEMKVGDNKPTEKQQAFIAYLDSAGYKTGVHWTSESAIDSIREYLGCATKLSG